MIISVRLVYCPLAEALACGMTLAYHEGVHKVEESETRRAEIFTIDAQNQPSVCPEQLTVDWGSASTFCD